MHFDDLLETSGAIPPRFQGVFPYGSAAIQAIFEYARRDPVCPQGVLKHPGPANVK